MVKLPGPLGAQSVRLVGGGSTAETGFRLPRGRDDVVLERDVRNVKTLPNWPKPGFAGCYWNGTALSRENFGASHHQIDHIEPALHFSVKM